MKRIEKVDSLDDKRILIGLEAEGYRDYNKTLLLLSAGAFALSLFILDKMQSPNFILFLVYTWMFWTLALLMQLASLSMYPKALREEIVALHHEGDTAPVENKMYWTMSKLNLLSTVSFGLGIFFFIVFVIYNRNCF